MKQISNDIWGVTRKLFIATATSAEKKGTKSLLQIKMLSRTLKHKRCWILSIQQIANFKCWMRNHPDYLFCIIYYNLHSNKLLNLTSTALSTIGDLSCTSLAYWHDETIAITLNRPHLWPSTRTSSPCLGPYHASFTLSL